MKKSLSNAVTAVLVLSAVTVAALVARRELASAPPQAPAGPPPERDVPGWGVLAAEGSVLGDSAATLRIVEFSDFQCGYCNHVRPELAQLRALDPGRIAIVYRHYAREDTRPASFAAAMAAECAGAQGRFAQYHDALFDGQASIPEQNWAGFARTAGVPDVPSFARCIEEERFRARVERDLRAAEELGAPGTPTFVFDGKMVIGVRAPARLEELVRAALARGAPTAGTSP